MRTARSVPYDGVSIQGGLCQEGLCQLGSDIIQRPPPPPPVNRMTKTQVQNHYLPATSFAGGKYTSSKLEDKTKRQILFYPSKKTSHSNYN